MAPRTRSRRPAMITPIAKKRPRTAGGGSWRTAGGGGGPRDVRDHGSLAREAQGRLNDHRAREAQGEPNTASLENAGDDSDDDDWGHWGRKPASVPHAGPAPADNGCGDNAAKKHGSIRHPRDTGGWFVVGAILRNIFYKGSGTAVYWSAPVGNYNADDSPAGEKIRKLGKHEAFGPITHILPRPKTWVNSRRWDRATNQKVDHWVKKNFIVAAGPDPADRSKTIYVNCNTNSIPWLERIPPGMKPLYAPPDFFVNPQESHKEIENPLPVNSAGVPVPGHLLQQTSRREWEKKQEEEKWRKWQNRDQSPSRQQAPHHCGKTWQRQRWGEGGWQSQRTTGGAWASATKW